MTETSLLSADIGTAVKLVEGAYAREEDPLTPEKARSLEILTETALQVAGGLQAVWGACTRNGTVWETGYYLSRMRAVEFLALIAVDILTRTEQILSHARARHPEWVVPPGASEVRAHLDGAQEVLKNVRELLGWLNRPRPGADAEMIRRSQEALNRGEGEALDDIIARLNQGGPLIKE